MMDRTPLLPSPFSPPPKRGPWPVRNWLIGCGVLVVVCIVGFYALVAYAFTHADLMPVKQPATAGETFSRAPAIAETGTGSAVPPHLVYRVSEPRDSVLTVELSSAYFLWVPTGVNPSVRSSQRSSTSYFSIHLVGAETEQWTLIARSTASTASTPGISTPKEIPGGNCPAQLPIPLTTAVQNCVIATATIYVGVT